MGYHPKKANVVVTAGQTASVHLTLPSHRGNVSGRVLLQGTNVHSGVTVSVEGQSGQAVTDVSGDFTLQGVLPGSHTLVARKDGYVDGQAQVTVAANETSTVNLTLEAIPPDVPVLAVRGGALTVRGSGFGAAQGGSVVRVGGASVQTVLSWADDEVRVRVPATARLGFTVAEVVVASPAQTVEMPVRVLAPATFSLSDNVAHVVTGDGTLVAWGNDDYGQRTVPPGLGSMVSTSASFIHSVALQADGTVVAWGDNWAG
ncbi:MAG: carboxypeptidase regulatory-like domain-containing protein [Myxococcaceae bacterium]|nr:carboxypeptidase regulatory-like domain-containing protein [Myxococcaceae bacterium]MCI0670866.1 carboxypeptidase regulatory-like domain-containing protein [Myxococcaceae bacterium]